MRLRAREVKTGGNQTDDVVGGEDGKNVRVSGIIEGKGPLPCHNVAG